jgi:polyhydroxyalkanoate synthase subunit PhaC
MKPIRMDPRKVAGEVADWWEQLDKSLRNLPEVKDARPGVTPFEEVLEIERFKLLRFRGEGEPRWDVPLLISYALVNRFTVADLQEDKSLVRSLLEQGFPVYVMDWGYPRLSDRMLDLDTYINEYIDESVDYLCKEHGVEAVNLLGICQGGTLAVTYTALHPEKVANLVTMVAPINFQTDADRLSHLVQGIDIPAAMLALGNLPGSVLNLSFNSLQPFSLNVKKWLESVKSLQDISQGAFFVRMERWINDSPDLAGQAFLEFITQFYQQNGIIENSVRIGDNPVDYRAVRCPVLNVFARHDHLVPPASSRALKEVVGSTDYTEMEIPTGHIGMYVSRAASRVPEAIGAWLAERG